MNTKIKTEITELKVLVLEDSLRDTELMREQLINAGYRVDLAHVENEAGFTAALRKNRFDLILADFKLPDIDGFGALQISRELCPETPFICVSGTIGEETAVELLKLGAVDYVLKDRPDRLPFAVKRALEEAEVKSDYQKAAEALRKSEENLSITLRSIGDGVISTDLNGMIVNMNPIAEELCGWPSDEAAGKPLTEVFKIISNITRETVADPVEKVLRNGKIVVLANHTVLISRNGNEYQIADSAAPIKNKADKLIGVVMVFSDVSDNMLHNCR